MRRASALLERLAAPPARATQERYRHELKYLINEGEHAALACRMAPVLNWISMRGRVVTPFAACTLTTTATRPTRKKTPVFSCAKSIACASITAATR